MLAVGQSAELGDSTTNQTEGTVTVESVTVTTHPADPSLAQAPANGYYVVVHVKATADSGCTDGFDINKLDFYALEHGNHYQEGTATPSTRCLMPSPVRTSPAP